MKLFSTRSWTQHLETALIAGIALLVARGGIRAAADPVDPASGAAVPAVVSLQGQGYQLAWSDEFNGASLDEGKWLYRTDSKSKSTQLPANVIVSDGLLHLMLKKESVGGKNYTGAGVISKGTFEYGYYEARFRIPKCPAWHTSFWTQLYNGLDTKHQKASQEIDICEQDSVNPWVYTLGIHAWGTNASEAKKHYGGKAVGTGHNLADGFHVWGMEFTPEKVNFYFDGKLEQSDDARGIHPQGPQNIWLTSIGVVAGGKSIDDAQLPAEADFDYVRVFCKPKDAEPSKAQN